jgi:acetylornithine deacetylase/succinyl-diaminopimelate desuccinylase-like protein
MLVSDRQKLLDTAKKNEQAGLECLRQIIRIPTCYTKKHDMRPIIEQLTTEFEKRGYGVQVFPTAGAPVFVADLKRGAEKTLLFYNHYDVQPEEPLDAWESRPYELSLRNGRLYGRGASDNKGPLVANMFGVQNALEAGCELKCNVRFVIEGEEEAGSVHLGAFCREHSDLLKSDGCVWEWANAVPNQRSKIYAGVKGDVYFELRAKGFHKDAHSGDAPIVVNPAWRLVWALSTLKDRGEKVLIEGFYDDVLPPRKDELELFAGYPPEEIEQYKQLYKTNVFLLDRRGVDFWKELILRPTCTICGLSAGWEGPGSKTVIGKDAMAKLDVRLVPNQRADKIQKLLRAHLDKQGFPDIEVKLLEGYGPSRTAVGHPYIQLLARLATDFSGKTPVVIPSSQGSGPAYVFGPHTPWAICDVSDPEANTHAPNESMRLRDFLHMTAFAGAIAAELGGA